jgi:hypothetical protein
VFPAGLHAGPKFAARCAAAREDGLAPSLGLALRAPLRSVQIRCPADLSNL